jgi:hypothetical protein
MRSGKSGYGGIVFGEKEIAQAGPFAGYQPLVEQIAKFFVTGVPPIEPQETLEMFAFMTAADESKKRGGAAVSLQEVRDAARQGVAARLSSLGE